MSDIDKSSENVLYDWSGREQAPSEDATLLEQSEDAAPSWGTATAPEPAAEEREEPSAVDVDPAPAPAPEAESAVLDDEPDDAVDDARADAPGGELEPVSVEHAPGELEIPDGYAVLEGVADGARRAIAVVVARFNGEVTSRLLQNALDELDRAGVRQDAITVMVVPGAFELPLAATALAKTRRYACVVALACVIRGDTPHFDYVASEAASGLQLAALETGVPVSFGVLTLDRIEQADARIEKGTEAVRTALEMADVFSHLRAAASR
jgi:6,7-dimethyl-8-ribityllumazine synthase